VHDGPLRRTQSAPGRPQHDGARASVDRRLSDFPWAIQGQVGQDGSSACLGRPHESPGFVCAHFPKPQLDPTDLVGSCDEVSHPADIVGVSCEEVKDDGARQRSPAMPMPAKGGLQAGPGKARVKKETSGEFDQTPRLRRRSGLQAYGRGDQRPEPLRVDEAPALV